MFDEDYLHQQTQVMSEQFIQFIVKSAADVGYIRVYKSDMGTKKMCRTHQSVMANAEISCQAA